MKDTRSAIVTLIASIRTKANGVVAAPWVNRTTAHPIADKMATKAAISHPGATHSGRRPGRVAAKRAARSSAAGPESARNVNIMAV